MSGGANNNRLTSMTYPNGEVLNYNYACFPVYAKCQVGISVAHRRVVAVICGSRLAKARALGTAFRALSNERRSMPINVIGDI
jgi:hypothetical protein